MVFIFVSKNILEANKTEYSFRLQDFISPFFNTEEDCLIFLLEYCLQKQLLLVHVKGLHPALCKKIDAAFGQSFKLKFRFANSNLDEFISFAMKKSLEKNNFFLKLTSLIAPFYKVSYESPDSIILKLPNQTDPEVQQFFDSKVIFQSEHFSYSYQPGDLTFFADASCDNLTTLAGAALQNKHMICAFRKFLPYEDNNFAELRAILETIFLAKDMSVQTLILYTDNANAIDFLSGKTKITEKNAHYFQIIDSIKEALNNFSSYSIAWVPRKKNFIADNLSKQDFNGVFFHR